VRHNVEMTWVENTLAGNRSLTVTALKLIGAATARERPARLGEDPAPGTPGFSSAFAGRRPRTNRLANEAYGSHGDGSRPEGRGEARIGTRFRFQGHLAPVALEAADALEAGKDEGGCQGDQRDADKFEAK
jgi:hypothetical protein